MTTDSTLAAGLRRMILIDSGKCAYVDLPLDQALYLAGPNNRGKTSIIAATQFLYLPGSRDYDFSGHNWEESRRYYFPRESSAIIFECQTPFGRRCMVVRCTSSLAGSEFQRFVYPGGYEREDWIDGDRVRGWQEVLKRLIARYGSCHGPIEARELPSLITGLGHGRRRDTEARLDLIPLRREDQYRLFVVAYGHLINLRAADQRQLQELLIAAAIERPERMRVDLKAEFEQDYLGITRSEQEVDRFESIHSEADEGRRLWNDYQRLCAGLAEINGIIVQWQRSWEREHERNLNNFERRRDALDGEIGELQNFLDERQRHIGRRDGEIERTHAQIVDIEERLRIDALDPFLPHLYEQELGVILAESRRLERALEESATASLERLREDRDRARDALERHRSLLEAREHSLAGVVQELLDAEDARALWMLADPRLAGLRRDRGDFSVHNADAFAAELRALAERVIGNGYHSSSFEIGPGRLLPASGIDDSDPDELRRVERRLKRNMEEADELLLVAEQRNDAERRLAELREREAALRHREEGHRRLQGDRERLPRLQEEARHMAALQEQTKAEIAERQAEQEGLRRRRSEAEQQCLEAHDRWQRLLEQMSQLLRAGERHEIQVASSDDDSEQPEHDPAILLEVHQQTVADLDHISQRLQALEQIIRKQTALGGDSGRDAFWARIGDEIDTLPDKRSALERRWQILLIRFAHRSRELIDGIASIEQVVHRMSRRLAQVNISDLRGIKLEVQRNDEILAELQLFGLERDADGEQTTLDLGDSAERERAAMQLRVRLEGARSYAIGELFQVLCKVTRVDGSELVCRGLDRMESTGTTVAIKVAIYIDLLTRITRGVPFTCPWYLDEAGRLDARNLHTIISFASERGFLPILADPMSSPGACPRTCLIPDTDDERLVIDHRQLVEVDELDEAGEVNASR